MTGEEKRRHERVRLQRPVRLSTADGSGREYTAQLRDLSVGGMGVVCDRELPVGCPVRCRFRIPYGNETREVTLKGRVRHCRVQSSGLYLGIAFTGLSAQASQFLETVVNEIKRRRREDEHGWRPPVLDTPAE